MKNSKKTWLWEISSPEGEDSSLGVSYLFGTIHIRDKRAFHFLEGALDYLNDCEAVATEFNLDEANRFSSGNSLDAPPDFSLEKVLSPKQLDRLNKLFQWQVGLPLSNFYAMHPFVLSSLLTESIMSKDMPMSLDQTIWQAGKSQGKYMDGLESYAFQMELVQKLGLKEQVKMLKGMIRNFKSFRVKQERLVDLYAAAEVGLIHQMSRRQTGAFRKPLLHDRNYFMADRIVQMMQEKTHFFAVGGGHLPGKHGLIRLLKIRKLNIKPVSLS